MKITIEFKTITQLKIIVQSGKPFFQPIKGGVVKFMFELIDGNDFKVLRMIKNEYLDHKKAYNLTVEIIYDDYPTEHVLAARGSIYNIDILDQVIEMAIV